MLLFAIQFSLLAARISLIRAASASCMSRLLLHRFSLCRERLLRLGAHRWLLEGFRRLANASLGVLCGLACLSRFATEERETDSLKIKGAFCYYPILLLREIKHVSGLGNDVPDNAIAVD